MGVPDPPSFVDLKRDVYSSSSLILHFTMVSHPLDKGSIVDSFLIEWSTSLNFEKNVNSIYIDTITYKSKRLSGYEGINESFFEYKIQNLNP